MITTTEDDKVNLIITKAQELGLDCQISKDHQWKIYLKDSYILSQGETGWVLPIQEGLEIYMSNTVVFDFLKKWYLYI